MTQPDNKPLSVTGTDGITEYYAYGPNGERVKRTRGSLTTVYLGSWEEDLNSVGGSLLERRIEYKFGGSVFLSWSSDPTKGNTYLHADHLGSVSVTSSDTGALVSQQTFDPWGKVRSGGGGGTITQTTNNYTGQKLDGTGLLFYNARYYDPSFGKFLSADTIFPDSNKPQSFNRYSYVLNNPIKFVDPSGHENCASDDTECLRRRANDKFTEFGVLVKGGLDSWTNQQIQDFLYWVMRGVKFKDSSRINNWWTAQNAGEVIEALNRTANYVGYNQVGNLLGLDKKNGLTFNLADIGDQASTSSSRDGTTINVGSNFFNDSRKDGAERAKFFEYRIETIIHELGHEIDYNLDGLSSSAAWLEAAGWREDDKTGGYTQTRSGKDGAASGRAKTNPAEDFAESFAFVVTKKAGKTFERGTNRASRDIDDKRINFFEN